MWGLLAAGCGETGVLGSDRQLQITVTADRLEGLVGTEFAFRVEATGNSFQQVIVAFGDGNESVSPLNQLAGATRVGLTAKHTYAAAGTYRVVATVEELSTANQASHAIDIVVR